MLLLAGDTLLLVDRAQNRFSWVTADRGVVRTASIDGALPFSARKLVGGFPDGRRVIAGRQLREPVANQVTRPDDVIYTLGDSGRVREFAKVPGYAFTEVETNYRGPRGRQRRMQPTHVRLAGSSSIAMLDSFVLTAVATKYQVDFRSGDGAVVRQLSLPQERRAVTQAMREKQIEFEVEQLSAHAEKPFDPEESERLTRSAPYSDSLPAIASLHVTPGSTVWVVEPLAPGDTVWHANEFSAAGKLLRRLTARGSGTPLRFGDDRVAVREEDTEGFTVVRVYRLRSRSATRR
jgi:hypothetical protein